MDWVGAAREGAGSARAEAVRLEGGTVWDPRVEKWARARSGGTGFTSRLALHEL
jgi:hypothetical protein